jgi:hypothetical protein
MVVRKIFMHCNSPQKSAEQGKQQKNVNFSAKHLLSHTHAKYLYIYIPTYLYIYKYVGEICQPGYPFLILEIMG